MENHKTMELFSFILGLSYSLAGIVQIGKGIGLLNSAFAESLFIPGETAGGFVLLVVGAVFIAGWNTFRADQQEGIAYVYVGILLSLIFAAVYMLSMVANGMEAYLLSAEGFENWTPLSDLKPAVYLGLAALGAYLGWKEKFSFSA
ncbi:hypothetical protein J2755_001653 [Methanohalophilus levihalophilus]|uniref:hypothetical protein n=1 Tax=Methanohalophilus levihalophilus TaxID=1431282 RepID=UPI001AEA3326|nr:hypothetical protein [Methanohalophilus levihalophilus]MBP2030705.1 hypothetical protein [Methanohalophilus levihalophilus]